MKTPDIKYYIMGSRHQFKISTFPGGEVNVSLYREHSTSEPVGVIKLFARITNSDSIMAVLLATDALRRSYPNNDGIELTMPYLPYARQDRVCNTGEALSIRVFADLINSQNYRSVEVHDAHSDVGPALIDRCTNVCVSEILTWWIFRDLHKDSILISPDAGSNKKVEKISRAFDRDGFIRADKTRDTKTGEITGTKVYGDVMGKNCLIVDDICDGGRTFIALAKELRAEGAKHVSLYVTHGIFSNGLDELYKVMDHIITTQSFCELQDTDRLKVLGIRSKA